MMGDTGMRLFRAVLPRERCAWCRWCLRIGLPCVSLVGRFVALWVRCRQHAKRTVLSLRVCIFEGIYCEDGVISQHDVLCETLAFRARPMQ